MYVQNVILKKKTFISLLIGICLLCACGQSVDGNVDGDIFAEEAAVNHLEKGNPIPIKTGDGKINDIGDPSMDSPKPFDIPVNTTAEEFHYHAVGNADPLSGTPGTKSDGKNIYLLTDHSFYEMPIGTDETRPLDIEVPAGMEVYNFALDGHGRIHLLIAQRDMGEYYIWRLDGGYQAEKTIAISDYYTDSAYDRPRWFLVLDDGTYYIQWPLEQDGIIVSSEGALKHSFTLESLGIGWVKQVTVGRDGHIHIAHGIWEEKVEIVMLDTDSGSVINENPDLLFPYDEIFFAMSGGTDTNLLLYSIYSGAWAFDAERGVMENRVSLADIRSGFSREAEFWPRIFLPDGRLFLVGASADDNADNAAADNAPLLIKYIPVGK